MSKVCKIIFNTMLILIIIMLSSYFILRLVDKIRIYNVETGSMEDKIHTGDYILLVKRDNYHVGDVITYKVNGYYITHRIVKIEDNVITTKGDANNTEDEGITKDKIEGKVVYCGGLLNFVINYKYVIVAFLIGLYLLSCYFGTESDEVINPTDSNKESNESIFNMENQEIKKVRKSKEIKQENLKEKIVEKTKKTTKVKKQTNAKKNNK